MSKIAEAAQPARSQEVATRPEDSGVSLLNFVAMAVKDPAIDVTKLEALLRMQREIVADDAKAQFNQAFIRLQKRLPRIKKEGELTYPVNKNQPDGPQKHIASFAKWEDIDAALRPLLDEEGFALSFNTAPRPGEGGGLLVTAILRHRAGHSQETSIPVPLDTSGGKNTLQGYGSTLSYGKRYAATAALNIVTEGEDDDGKRGGVRYITGAEAREIDELLTQTKADRPRFLEYFGVANIAALEASQLAQARNMLLQKKGRMGR
jgi:ERF superfamily